MLGDVDSIDAHLCATDGLGELQQCGNRSEGRSVVQSLRRVLPRGKSKTLEYRDDESMSPETIEGVIVDIWIASLDTDGVSFLA
jgi:hypothetical protein